MLSVINAYSISPRRKAVDDDCLIVGVSRDALRAKEAARRVPDRLCPLQPEYYKEAVKRVSFGVRDYF